MKVYDWMALASRPEGGIPGTHHGTFFDDAWIWNDEWKKKIGEVKDGDPILVAMEYFHDERADKESYSRALHEMREVWPSSELSIYTGGVAWGADEGDDEFVRWQDRNMAKIEAISVWGPELVNRIWAECYEGFAYGDADWHGRNALRSLDEARRLAGGYVKVGMLLRCTSPMEDYEGELTSLATWEMQLAIAKQQRVDVGLWGGAFDAKAYMARRSADVIRVGRLSVPWHSKNTDDFLVEAGCVKKSWGGWAEPYRGELQARVEMVTALTEE